jgi:hypothetical protein
MKNPLNFYLTKYISSNTLGKALIFVLLLYLFLSFQVSYHCQKLFLLNV